jgi:hypothetical protein
MSRPNSDQTPTPLSHLWERLSGLGHVAVKPQKKAIEKAEQVAHRARVYLNPEVSGDGLVTCELVAAHLTEGSPTHGSGPPR